MFSANSSQVSDEKLYVEDVFSTYLYTGTGSAQTITNGIDLAGKGGMVWIKSRSAATSNFLFDTSRGVNVEINSDTTNANATLANSLTAFNSNGFSISSATGIGVNAATYASWTFREAANFFDVVTYTGNGTTQSISHNLGVAPGVIIVKQTSTTTDWVVYHRSLGETYRLFLNLTNAATNTTPQNGWGNNTTAVAPTSTNFTVGDFGVLNANGGTYVAYLFAHDTTSDGIIQCGSYSGTGSRQLINCGWEAQWVLIKRTDTANSWFQFDNMRGFDMTQCQALLPNGSNSELDYGTQVQPDARGFTVDNNAAFNASGGTYIYIAIRRGPMRIPTSGTSVFAPVANVTSGGGLVSTNFPVDMTIASVRSGTTYKFLQDRLRGVTTFSYGNNAGSPVLNTNSTAAEDTTAFPAVYGYDNNVGTYRGGTQIASSSNIFWNFRRAPSFFDEVCYTGTGSATTFNHNLGVAPELMIVKPRGSSGSWRVYAAPLTATKYLTLNQTAAAGDDSTFGYAWNKTAPTSTVFSLGTGDTNSSGVTHVNYLFASCPGVSKVGSYTGNGSSQTINCGFAAGARFVMIKRTDSTGDWYVWDTARGIVAANDPHLSLNTTAAEVTTDDSIDTDSSGFVVNQVAATNINVSSATYIYLAVA